MGCVGSSPSPSSVVAFTFLGRPLLLVPLGVFGAATLAGPFGRPRPRPEDGFRAFFSCSASLGRPRGFPVGPGFGL